MDTNILIGMAIGILLSAILWFARRFYFKKQTRKALQRMIGGLRESDEPKVYFTLILKSVFDDFLNIRTVTKNSFADILLKNFEFAKEYSVKKLLDDVSYIGRPDNFNLILANLQEAILETSLPLELIIFKDKPMSEQRLTLIVARSVIKHLEPIIEKKFTLGENLSPKDVKLFYSISGVVTTAPTSDVLALDYTLNAEQVTGSITKLLDELETIMLELDPSYERFKFKQLAA